MKFIATSTPCLPSLPEQIYSPLLSSFEALATSEAAHNERDKDGGWDETNYGGDKNFPSLIGICLFTALWRW